MTAQPFARSLVRKSERAIRSARLSLQNGDPDSAVNRAYYAMFNMSRAALLNLGVSEGDLPRTHRGVSEAFRQYAVLPGRIEPGLASALTRAENLRLRADYTATEIPADAAGHILEEAERYVRAVEHAFGLERSEGRDSDSAGALGPDPIEEQRRVARENWLHMRHEGNQGAASAEQSRGADDDTSKTTREREQGYGLGDETEDM